MTQYKEIPERLQKVAKLREEGKTFREIGEEFGVTNERARQLYKKYIAYVNFNKGIDNAKEDDILRLLVLAQKESNCSDYLVTRTYNCLYRCGIVAECNNDIRMLYKYTDEQLLKQRNFGVACLDLIHVVKDILHNDGIQK